MIISRVEILMRARTISSLYMSHLLSLKSSNLGRRKSWGSNIGVSDNTEDEGKTVGGAIGAYGGGIGDSLLVALYACMTFIYRSLRKGEMASEAKRYLEKSSEGSGEVFLGEAGK
uniref:Uncharacterized protein n=1 Tax=Tanacetum cinerariifolium TaxID=118510 RepID=A0A6L2JVU7_TANCI|nr:hypothetical protein [Tanacetum cinerariifolium]